MTFIDLFSGIGGFRVGLEMAGHTCIGHCEINKFANLSYKSMHNIKETEWFNDDIKKIRSDEIPYADIYTAGFPCQDCSVAGYRKGLSGERSGLFFEVVRIIKGKGEKDKPEWLIFENVKGLLSLNAGEDFNIILFELSEIGYDCEWQILNSKDFGVPQNRERVYIIGHLRSRGERKIFPITRSNPNTLKQIVGGQQGNRVYSTEGVSCTLTSQGGGGGAKTGLYFVDLTNNNPKITTVSRCLTARQDRGISNRKAEGSGVIENPRAILTPNRINKRQNGRRAKSPNEEMFTLTAQDRLT
jgi:DNA (cytosine-5)-methyltransferase 1